jgi:hypothetical protein
VGTVSIAVSETARFDGATFTGLAHFGEVTFTRTAAIGPSSLLYGAVSRWPDHQIRWLVSGSQLRVAAVSGGGSQLVPIRGSYRDGQC